MADRPPVSTAGGPPASPDAKRKRNRVFIIGGIAVAAGVAFILWRNHQAAAAGSSSSQDTGSGAGAPLADTAGLQGGAMQGATGTETLVIKIRDMQGRRRRPPLRPPWRPQEPPRRSGRPPFSGGGGPGGRR